MQFSQEQGHSGKHAHALATGEWQNWVNYDF
jgi:hypothetical protein